MFTFHCQQRSGRHLLKYLVDATLGLTSLCLALCCLHIEYAYIFTNTTEKPREGG